MANLYVFQARAIEDDIFGLTMQIKQYPQSRKQIYSDIHDKVGELVDLGIQERKPPIEHMQEMVASEEIELAHDTERRGDMIEERVGRLMDRINTSDSSPRSEATPIDDSPMFADAGMVERGS